MKIGIIGAMDEEIKELKSFLTLKSEKVVTGNIFYEGILFGRF